MGSQYGDVWGEGENQWDEWLLGMIKNAGLIDALAKRLLAWHEDSDDGYGWNSCGIASYLYELGYTEVKDWLYRVLDKDMASTYRNFSDSWECEDLLKIDGENALIYICERMPEWYEREKDNWDYIKQGQYAIEVYDDWHGKGKAIRVLEACESENSGVRKYLAQYRIERKEEQERGEDREERHERWAKEKNIEDVLAWYRSDQSFEEGCYWCLIWMGTASKADLNRVMDLMLTRYEDGDLELADFQYVFRWPGLPRFDDRIMTWLEEDRDVTLEMIHQVKHPKVRAYAIAEIEGGCELDEEILRVFSCNWEAGDERVLEKRLYDVKQEDSFGWVGLFNGLQRLTARWHEPSLLTLKKYAYRYGGYWKERRSAVKGILSVGDEDLKAWVREEAKHDAAEAVRKLVS
ncbi:hypothetical protein JD969_09580 [Planctomycetota bacterium]|nr:hypothetical protein JD969_09580 [Planctomycetota bacterium]